MDSGHNLKRKSRYSQGSALLYYVGYKAIGGLFSATSPCFLMHMKRRALGWIPGLHESVDNVRSLPS